MAARGRGASEDGSPARAPVLIWGGGGHGKVVADLVRACGHSVAGYIDADPGKVGECVEPGGAVVVVSEREFLENELRSGTGGSPLVVVAIGDNRARWEIFGKLGSRVAPALVHPSAVISPSARIGAGTVVFANAVVNAGAFVGRGAIVNTGAVVEHDCVVGDGAHVSPGATLAGGMTLGARSWVGTGATVIPRVQIGDEAVVGAGAVVIRDVEASTTVVGNPARVIARSGRHGSRGGR